MGILSSLGRKLGLSGEKPAADAAAPAAKAPEASAKPYAERISDAANAGDVDAMIEFGDFYFHSAALFNARRCYQAAANHGNVLGAAKLLMIRYLWKEEVPEQEARDILDKAYAQSHEDGPTALFFSQLWEQGTMFGERDPESAMKYCEVACEKGLPDAFLQKAMLLREKGEDPLAVQKLIEQAAAMGSTRALCAMAMELARSNPARSRQYMEQAAREGVPAAFLMLGTSPLSNSEDEKKRCMNFIIQAAECGSYIAQHKIFSMFGNNLPDEYVKYIGMAAENHLPPAMGVYGMMLTFGGRLEQNRNEGIKWLNEAVKFNDPDAMTGLALALLNTPDEEHDAVVAMLNFEGVPEPGKTDEERRQNYMQIVVRLLMSGAMLGNERALQELAELDKHIGTDFAEQAKKVLEENRRKAMQEAGLDPDAADAPEASPEAPAEAAPAAAEPQAFPGTAPNKD